MIYCHSSTAAAPQPRKHTLLSFGFSAASEQFPRLFFGTFGYQKAIRFDHQRGKIGRWLRSRQIARRVAENRDVSAAKRQITRLRSVFCGVVCRLFKIVGYGKRTREQRTVCLRASGEVLCSVRGCYVETIVYKKNWSIAGWRNVMTFDERNFCFGNVAVKTRTKKLVSPTRINPNVQH